MRSLVLVPLAFAFMACSTDVTDIHAESTSGSSGTATGAGGHGTMGAGGGSTSTASTTSGAGGSGAGPACCTEPVHVAGKVKVVTADTDPDQLVTKTSTDAFLVSGPFMLTGAAAGGQLFLTIVTGTDCSIPNQPPFARDTGDVRGARMFVPAGSSICGGAGGITFSGFRPY